MKKISRFTVFKCLCVILLFCAIEYRIQEVERRLGITTFQANANTSMASQSMMMVHDFYDQAPAEIIRLVRSIKCNCGLSSSTGKIISVEEQEE